MKTQPSTTLWLGLLSILLHSAGCASTGPHANELRSTQAEEIPWVEVRTALGYNWSEAVNAMPEAVDRIDRVLRNRAVYRRDGFGFGHLMLGSGALYPYHAHASPEAYHVLSGEAEWSVDGETRRVGPGTTIYHAPYADHRWVTVGSEPLRVVWAQWAPDGDRSGLVADAVRRQGGATTGPFLEGERSSRSILPIQLAAPINEPVVGGVVEGMRRARLAARMKEPSRPAIRAFHDSVGTPWNASLSGVRWRPVFGTPDLEWGHVEISGPGRREIPPSATPWLLHVISGEARLRPGDADEIGGRAGTSVVVWPGESIEIEFSTADGEAIPNAEPIRAVWVRWSPEPDLSYWGRDYFLVEEMPEPPPSAELPKDIPFF